MTGDAVKLKCPHCGHESSLAQAPRFDLRCVCMGCGVESDYRLMRDAWIEQRRSDLPTKPRP